MGNNLPVDVPCSLVVIFLEMQPHHYSWKKENSLVNESIANGKSHKSRQMGV